jgi:serine/threonine protein kinase
MAITKELNGEPIAGYRLVNRLGRGGFAEVWQCEAPGGLFKAVKFVHGNLNAIGTESSLAERELRALHRVKAVRHPFILTMERVEIIGGELVIVMELADKNLEERLTECQAVGLPGIPREELLAYLRDAAEALDLMNFQHDLQHLDVKPRNLFLVGNRLKVADFGLVRCLEGLASTSPNSGLRGEFTPHYSAPEIYQGVVSRHSDQYSLAIVYQELLTGTRPFQGTNPRQLALQHLNEAPNLAPLSESDRPVVAKALAKAPQDRHLSCLAFVRALLAQSAGGNGVSLPPRSVDPATDTPLPPALRMSETMEDLFLAAPDPTAMSDHDLEVPPQRLSELQVENAELRRLLAHSRTGLKRANEKADAEIREWQRRYENVMKNKFDALRRQMSGIGHNALGYGPSAPPLPAPAREELLAIHQELDRQRSQLKREEKELHAQIRHEEVQLCKERAELSRMRSEWVRLHPENAPQPAGPAHQELVRLQQQLQREREQLKQDEQSLKEQMELLEKQVTHERAELARQRADWDRKQREMKTQFDMMTSAEAALTEKLVPLAQLKDKIEELLSWRRQISGNAS